MNMEKVVLLVVVLCTVMSFGCAHLMSNPIHASCKIDWTFGLSCKDCSDKIIKQMDVWKGDNCSGSEKCLYKYQSFDGKTLKGTHTTPVKHYVDDLTFTFYANGSTACNVNGYSTSETWYAVLDYGTNYCNLHNLIIGSGLDKVKSYTETTSDSKCTQYSSANCDKY